MDTHSLRKRTQAAGLLLLALSCSLVYSQETLAQPVRSGLPSDSPQPASSQLPEPLLRDCIISVKEEVQLPAEEAGVIRQLTAYEGQIVRSGEVLGQIDDMQPRMQKKMAELEQDAAKHQAENDIDIRYANAAAKVAEAEYQKAIEANSQSDGAIPEAEVRRLKLAWNRAVLQIEQARFDKMIAGYTVRARASDVEAAEENIARRKIDSPVDGEVISLLKHKGEWAHPGDPILRIVRFDVLRIEGFLSNDQYDPREVVNRPVSIEVQLARGRKINLAGTLVYASPIVQAGGEYRVWAEVNNRLIEGQWQLRPGLTATMTIHVNRPKVKVVDKKVASEGNDTAVEAPQPSSQGTRRSTAQPARIPSAASSDTPVRKP